MYWEFNFEQYISMSPTFLYTGLSFFLHLLAHRLGWDDRLRFGLGGLNIAVNCLDILKLVGVSGLGWIGLLHISIFNSFLNLIVWDKYILL